MNKNIPINMRVTLDTKLKLNNISTDKRGILNISNTITKLIERATQKKPNEITTDTIFKIPIGYCPNCNQIVQEDYCGWCGQYLDWGGVNVK